MTTDIFRALSPSSANNRKPLSIATSDDEDVKTGKAWARAVHDPWDPLILTLDGGGIRGYSSLLLVQRLMREVAKWENKLEEEEEKAASQQQDRTKSDFKTTTPTSKRPRRIFKEDELLPCHYFDYMYGTSTGGLIATMLGRLRMSVPQCLRIYRRVGNDLFGKRRSKVPLATKYDHRPLETAVRDIVKAHCKTHKPGQCNGEDFHPWAEYIDDVNATLDKDSESRICQSICLTATHNGRIDEAYLLRTYAHSYVKVPNWITLYNEGVDHMRIWQVTRATSAAPFYFKMLEADIKGELKGFKDGGIRENNPAGAAWSEFVSMYGEEADPALLLSIGTGRPNESHDGFASIWPGPLGQFKLTKKAAEKFAVFKNVLIKYTEGEEKHRAMVNLAHGEHKWYKRLNVSEGLETMKLDNWEKGLWRDPATDVESIVSGGASLSRMERVTTDYLEREFNKRFDTYAPPKVMIEQVAEKLVRHRRAREKTQEYEPRKYQTFMGRWLTGKLGPEDGVVRYEEKRKNTDSSTECC